MKIFAASHVATGMERLKTNGFQLPLYASPGRPRKLMLLTNVANIDIPTTQDGKDPDAAVNEAAFLRLLNQKLQPNRATPSTNTAKTI